MLQALVVGLVAGLLAQLLVAAVLVEPRTRRECGDMAVVEAPIITQRATTSGRVQVAVVVVGRRDSGTIVDDSLLSGWLADGGASGRDGTGRDGMGQRRRRRENGWASRWCVTVRCVREKVTDLTELESGSGWTK